MSALLTVLGIAAGIAGVGGLLLRASQAAKKRTAALRGVAEEMGWSFQEAPGLDVIPDRDRFELFGSGHARKVRNFMAGEAGGARAAVFDYRYTTGGGQSQATWMHTVACVHLGEAGLPSFSVRPEHLFHKIGSALGYQDVDLEGHPAFSAAYLLRGPDEAAVRAAFTPAVAEFFEARQKLSSAGDGPVLLLWRVGRHAKAAEVPALLADAVELAALLRQGPSSAVAIDM